MFVEAERFGGLSNVQVTDDPVDDEHYTNILLIVFVVCALILEPYADYRINISTHYILHLHLLDS